MSLRVLDPLPKDVEHVVRQGGGMWEDLRDARLFLTGGTGFVGRWMLESLAGVNESLDLGVKAVVLSRRPDRFAAAAPHLAHASCVTLLRGDVRSFEFPSGEFTHIIHMATETDAAPASSKPSVEFGTAVDGTRRVLELASRTGARKLLYTSSGAVYGRQPAECTRVGEMDTFAPRAEDTSAAYAQGKRAAEFLCSAASFETTLEAKIARLFAFVGPFLKLDAGYAVGNFIRDALWRDKVRIAGDGTARRSYLYASDLAWWLWTVLIEGEPAHPYNIGSDQDLSILELAQAVVRALDADVPIEVALKPVPDVPPERYVPDVSRARQELELRPIVSLEDGIRRTASWHRAQSATQGGSRDCS